MRHIIITLCFCLIWSISLSAQEVSKLKVKSGSVCVNGFVFFKAVDMTIHALPEFNYQRNRFMYSGSLLFRTSGQNYTSIHSGNQVDIGGQVSILYKLNRKEAKNSFLIGMSLLQLNGKLNYEGLKTPGNSVWLKSSDATLVAARIRYQFHLGKRCYISLSESFGEQFSYGKGLPARSVFEMGTALGIGLQIF